MRTYFHTSLKYYDTVCKNSVGESKRERELKNSYWHTARYMGAQKRIRSPTDTKLMLENTHKVSSSILNA